MNQQPTCQINQFRYSRGVIWQYSLNALQKLYNQKTKRTPSYINDNSGIFNILIACLEINFHYSNYTLGYYDFRNITYVINNDIPDPDIAISMGCNVGCPFIGRPFDDNWGIEDPTGKSDEKFKIVIEQIRNDILELRSKLDKE